MFSVGIAGTAKNTGKTTTLAALLAAALRRGCTMALTGIGYDGEAFDQVTGLPKPRLALPRGVWVATARQALAAGTAEFTAAVATGVASPLGEVVVARVQKPGLALLAGPAGGDGLRQTLTCLAAHGPKLCLIDGALSRMAPMVEADSLILATGAARDQDPERLARETAAMAALLSLGRRPEPLPVQSDVITLFAPGQAPVFLGAGSLLTAAAVEPLLAATRQAALAGPLTVFVPGAVTLAALTALAASAAWPPGSELVLTDPIKLLLAGPAALVQQAVLRPGGGICLSVLRPVPLLAVTVNPFFPRRGPAGFTAAHVDAGFLRRTVQAQLSLPTIDVLQEGGDRLLGVIERTLQCRKGPAAPRRLPHTKEGNTI